jgi:xylan 1,4-beta-xylosidase
MYFDAPTNEKRASYFNAFSTYEYLISIGVRPVVELSFTPSPVNNGTCDHFYYKGCETVPTNMTLYGEYVQNFTTALKEHFGVAEVSSWYFEVYNEADLFVPS